MGWKQVKQHYQISYIVHVDDGSICIRSIRQPALIVIGADGAFKKRYSDSDSGSSSEELQRIQDAMSADPAKLLALIEAEDQFDKSVAVYTFEGYEILEKFCESPGWPRVTHAGELMYPNLYSTDKEKVIVWAKANAERGLQAYTRLVDEARAKLENLQLALEVQQRNGLKLQELYPEDAHE